MNNFLVFVNNGDNEIEGYIDNDDHLVIGEVIYMGKEGPQGPPGPQGVKGEPGIGLKGDKGDKGDPFVYSDFTPEQLAALKGPQGETGPRGEDGPQGVQGIQGIQGIPGEKGDKGDKGDNGASGVYIGTNAPSDPEVRVWIDTDDGSVIDVVTKADAPFRFGIDANGNYGYYKDGADSVTPFLSGGGSIIARETDDYVVYRIPGLFINVTTTSMSFGSSTSAQGVVYWLVFKDAAKYKVSSFNNKTVQFVHKATRCRIAAATSSTSNPFYGLVGTTTPSTAQESFAISGWGNFTEAVIALFMYFGSDENGNPVDFADVTLPV